MNAISSEESMRLLMAHRRQIHAYLRVMVGDVHLAEDVLQDVSTVVLRCHHEFTSGTNFLAWVTEIARRLALAELRRRKRTGHGIPHSLTESLAAEVTAADPWEQQREALHNCLKNIGGQGQDALMLRYAEALPVTSIASRLGRSVDGVKSLLKRLRSELADCIEARLREGFSS